MKNNNKNTKTNENDMNMVDRNSSAVSKVTIDDIANALGVSKTTVSRSISGKGRIGEYTRQRVMNYIDKMNYHPNVLARGLAESKTYNIGWIVPGDSRIADLPFFHKCLSGVCETAAKSNYDVLLSINDGKDVAHIDRVISNKKVDGVVVGRTLLDDANIKYLKANGTPFVVIGSTDESDVIQIDNDHFNACKELTFLLLMKGIRKIALIVGDSNHVVNHSRKRGFEAAIAENSALVNDVVIYMDSDGESETNKIVDEAIKNKFDCIVCADDLICANVVKKCQNDRIDIPGDIKIASFYDSDLLQNCKPGITAIQYDPKELGCVACEALLDFIWNGVMSEKIYLRHEIALRESTQNI